MCGGRNLAQWGDTDYGFSGGPKINTNFKTKGLKVKIKITQNIDNQQGSDESQE
ncbi:MAG: hypothetical protein ACOC2O_00630 [Bacillota bacterium]